MRTIPAAELKIGDTYMQQQPRSGAIAFTVVDVVQVTAKTITVRCTWEPQEIQTRGVTVWTKGGMRGNTHRLTTEVTVLS